MRKQPTMMQRMRVGAHLREMSRKLEAMRVTMYKLLAHPDATIEQIGAVRAVAVKMEADLRDLRRELAEKGYDPNLLI